MKRVFGLLLAGITLVAVLKPLIGHIPDLARLLWTSEKIQTTVELDKVRSSLVSIAPAASLTVMETERVLWIPVKGGLGDGATITIRVPCRISFAVDVRDLRAGDLQWNADKHLLVARLPRLSIHAVETRLEDMHEFKRSWCSLPRRAKTWDALRREALAQVNGAAKQQSQGDFPAASERARAEMARLLRDVLSGMGSGAEVRVE